MILEGCASWKQAPLWRRCPRRAALRRYYERDNANVHRGIHELSNRATAAFEAARDRTAKFINARSANEIIFTRGTTEGINLVATSWGNQNVKSGDVILLVLVVKYVLKE